MAAVGEALARTDATCAGLRLAKLGGTDVRDGPQFGDLLAISAKRCESCWLKFVNALHLHYIAEMKTSTLPAVRVEPALRSDAEAVLDEGESLSDFVATCVRDGVNWRRTQDAFLTRARDGVERSERENNRLSPQEVLRRMDARLDAARQRLAAGKPRAGQ